MAPTIGLDSVDDTNIDTDGVTAQNTNLTLTGIAQSYADVTLYVTNAGDTDCTAGTPVMTVEAGGNGVWKADLSGTVADGTYYYYVSSEYSPGNVFISDLYTMEVDSETFAPTLELLDDTGVADEWLDPAPNTSDSDWESSDATITGTVDEGATVVITATNTSTHAVTTVTIDPENLTKVNDEWTYNHDLSGLGDGEFDVQVTTTDLAGNTASSAVQTMYFDSQTVKPTVDLPDVQDTDLSVGRGRPHPAGQRQPRRSGHGEPPACGLRQHHSRRLHPGRPPGPDRHGRARCPGPHHHLPGRQRLPLARGLRGRGRRDVDLRHRRARRCHVHLRGYHH